MSNLFPPVSKLSKSVFTCSVKISPIKKMPSASVQQKCMVLNIEPLLKPFNYKAVQLLWVKFLAMPALWPYICKKKKVVTC